MTVSFLKRIVGLGEYRGLPCKKSTQRVLEQRDARLKAREKKYERKKRGR